MASASKTPKLNLPQWVGTEKPERTDFNAAFEAIDTTVASHLAEKATQEKLGHVKADNETIFSNDGVLSARTAYFEPIQSTAESGVSYFDINIGQAGSGVWELFLTGNPQPVGAIAYRAVNIGYITMNTKYSSGTVNRELHYDEVVRYSGGSDASKVLTVSVVFFNGSVESSTVDISINIDMRIKVSGYPSGYEGSYQELRLRRMI